MDKILKLITWEKLVPTLGIALIAIVLICVFNRLYKNFARKFEKGTKLAYAKILSNVCKVTVLALCIIAVFQIYGINVTSLVAGLGIAGAVVGLALQDYLKDAVMGIHIMTDKFFTVGDTVLFGGEEGIIVEFSINTTKIKMLADGSVLSVCNRNIDKITRLSEEVIIDVPLPYDLPSSKAVEVMAKITDVIAKEKEISECVFKGTQNFGESAIFYRLGLKCEPASRAQIRRNALGIVQNILEKEDIHIPFNQLDVHIEK